MSIKHTFWIILFEFMYFFLILNAYYGTFLFQVILSVDA